MKPITIVKIGADGAMYLLFLLLMAQYLLPGAPHEWLGISVGILFLAHNALNYKWYKALFKGRYNVLRTVQTAVNFLLWLGMLGCMVSGIIVAESVFHINAINAYEFGRALHLVATAWTFLLMSVHLGLHWAMFVGFTKRIPVRQTDRAIFVWIFRMILIAICVCGLYHFIEARYWEELLHLIDFQKEYNYEQSLFSYLLGSAALSVLFAAVSYYAKKLYLYCKRRKARIAKEKNPYKESTL